MTEYIETELQKVKYPEIKEYLEYRHRATLFEELKIHGIETITEIYNGMPQDKKHDFARFMKEIKGITLD